MLTHMSVMAEREEEMLNCSIGDRSNEICALEYTLLGSSVYGFFQSGLLI